MGSKATSKKLKHNPLNVQKEIDAKQRALDESQNEEHKLAMAKCIPIAREIVRIAHEAELEMGDISAQNVRPESYVKASAKIRQMMIDTNLPWIDRHFVFQLALQPIDKIKDIVLSDLAKSYEDGMTALLGVESFSTMTMGEMQKAFMDRFEAMNKGKKAKPEAGDLAVDPAKAA